ncbi:hypothetical protein NZ45_10360 [Clostridium botulinum]|uniref:Uncharacterized protein n=1 Tax=Clostridium botulinum TaxID=1491 RepID=A0ABD7CGW8_CLOBO|nr:hypothetical protein [Clostridium botulinum]KGO13813.1 hypothetical protein NZ45_10360 [Clostridium botulinum]QRI52184.1 hypothetical protein JQS73_12120 [Clostridium botulinum]
MAKGAEIKKVTIKIPGDTKIEEIEQRACAAYAKILCEMYSPDNIEKIIERLEKENKLGGERTYG